jgi:ankyrin repeat protein
MKVNSSELKQAASRGDLAEVKRLIAAGANVNSADQWGSGTLLTFHPQVIECLLAHGADPNQQTNENGASVLAGLCYVNQFECARVLLEQGGADPNRGRAQSGETPLHHALTHDGPGRFELVQLLLDHGADPNARTIPGVETANFWRDVRTRGETPLHRAAAYASQETILLLLGAGADPTIRDANGDSPLSWASWHQRPKSIIDLLMAQSNGKRTPTY